MYLTFLLTHPTPVATSFHSFLTISLLWYSLSFVSYKGFSSETSYINFSKSAIFCGEKYAHYKMLTEPTALTITAGKNKLV